MNSGTMNNKVAKELSDAMNRCKQQGVDEPSLRTGLLTITIANFVNRIGMDNTVALFEALPGQIVSGIFNRYIDPNTNTPRSYTPPTAAPPPQQPAPYPPAPAPAPPAPFMPTNAVPVNAMPVPQIPQAPQMPHASTQPPYAPPPQDPAAYSYQHTSMPQSFVPPYSPPINEHRPPADGKQVHQQRRRLTE